MLKIQPILLFTETEKSIGNRLDGLKCSSYLPIVQRWPIACRTSETKSNLIYNHDELYIRFIKKGQKEMGSISISC